MPKDIRVLIYEDDPYARDLMSLLLTRDWRTRVIAEVASREELVTFLKDELQKIDVVILDTEIPGDPDLPYQLAALTRELSSPTRVLYTGTLPHRDVLEKVMHNQCSGYIIKQDILYALGAAVAAVNAGACVVTPSVQQIAGRYALPNGTLVIDGRKHTVNFSNRENELIRLGIIFNLAIRDIADELVLGPGWVSEIVSSVYQKLGVRDILSGDVPLDLYFTDEAVLQHCRDIIGRSTAKRSDGSLRKAPWMSTLAFHLLTVPEITET